VRVCVCLLWPCVIMTPSSNSNSNSSCTTPYFLGFERSTEFEELWHRLQVLERWRELAIRPTSVEECHLNDRFLLPVNHRQKKKKEKKERDEEVVVVEMQMNQYDHRIGTQHDEVDDDDDDENNSEQDESRISSSSSSSSSFVMDDMKALQDQSLKVRQQMNNTMSTMAIETTEWDEHLVVRASQISMAGLGLYYIPSTIPSVTTTTDSISVPQLIPTNTVLCYCTGHIHSFSSSRQLLRNPNDREYLLWVHGDTLVDAQSLLYVKARYVNDPLNEKLINCQFVPPPPVDGRTTVVGAGVVVPPPPRAAVTTTRPIYPGEELFIQYGDYYWDQQPIVGTRLCCLPSVNTKGKED
jgi:hypothetical protein